MTLSSTVDLSEQYAREQHGKSHEFHPADRQYAYLIVSSMDPGVDYTDEQLYHAVLSQHPRVTLSPQALRKGRLYASENGHITYAGSRKNTRGRRCSTWKL